jgi:hypothetical protein
MLTEEQAANAYEEVTDGCRRSVRVTSDNARRWQRAKPDEETNPLAGFDWEKVPPRRISAYSRLLHCERARALDSDHSTSSLRVTKKPLRSGSCSIILRA